MYKINYNQHDWNKGEVIKEENLDNMENGIKQATNKINEIIDTEQDFKDRMADIDRRIDINNEELVVARDGCDNLGQRIERDQQYIYNILNDGSYLEFNGTDVTVDNSKEGYTSNMVIKGQTYQNLYMENSSIGTSGSINNQNVYYYENGYRVIKKDTEKTVGINILPYNNELQTGEIYTLILDIISDDTPKLFARNNYATLYQSFTKGLNVYKFTVDENTTRGIAIGDLSANSGLLFKYKAILLEGDWTNKEVPTSITGIESVGEKENNKISILSHNKNLFNFQMLGNTVKPSITDINSVHWVDKGVKAWQSINTWNNYTQLKPNTLYGIKCDLVIHDNKGKGGFYIRGTNNAVISCSENGSSGWFVTPADGLVCLGLRGTWADATEIDIEFNNITLVEFNTIPKTKEEKQAFANSIVLEKPKADKKEILLSLDGGLKSLPNGVADTIEQREDGIYLVQRIGKVVLNGSESWGLTNLTTKNIYYYKIDNLKPSDTEIVAISNNFIAEANTKWNDDTEESVFANNNGYLNIKISKSKLSSDDTNGFKQWLQANPVTVYYELNAPVETKLDLDTINLQTFKDLTYVTSDNNIKPTLSFKAPVDINQTIADLQEEQEQLIETYNTLKEENEAVKTAVSELNEQEDVQTADMLDLDMRVLALEEGLE